MRRNSSAESLEETLLWPELTKMNIDEGTVQPNILLAYEKLFLIIGIPTPEPDPRRHNKLVKFKLACAIVYHLMGLLVCCNFIWSFSKTSPSVHSLVDALAKCLLPPTLWWFMYSKTNALRDANKIMFDHSDHLAIHNIDISPWWYSIPLLVFIPLAVFGDYTIDSGSKNFLVSEDFLQNSMASVWVYLAGWPAYVVFQGIYIITGLFYIVQCMCRSFCIYKLNRLWHVINPFPNEYFDVCKDLLKNLECHMSGAITFVIVHCWIEFMTTLNLVTDLLVGRAAEISVVTCVQVIVLYCGIVLSATQLEKTLTNFQREIEELLHKNRYKGIVVQREPILTASGLVLDVQLLVATLLLAVSFGVMLYITKAPNNILTILF